MSDYEILADGDADSGYEVLADGDSDYSSASDLPASIAKKTYGSLANTLGGAVSFLEDIQPYTKYLSPQTMFQPDIKEGDGYGNDIRSYAQDYLDKVNQQYKFEPGSASYYADTIGTAVGQGLPVIAGGMMTGGAAALPMMLGQQFSSDYANAQNDGQDTLTSLARSTLNLPVNYLAGKVTLNPLFKEGSSLTRRVAESVGANALTSVPQTGLNQIVNKATGAKLNYQDFLTSLKDNFITDIGTGVINPTITHMGVKANRKVSDNSSDMRVDQLAEQLAEISAKSSIPTEDANASMVLSDAAQVAPDSSPRILDIYPNEQAGLIQETTRARTPEFQQELRDAAAPRIVTIVDSKGNKIDSNDAPQESPEIIKPFTKNGEIRKSLPNSEQALLKEIRLAEKQRKSAEEKMLPTVVKPSPLESDPVNKLIQGQSFPKVIEHAKKIMPDKGAQEGFVNSLKLQREAQAQGLPRIAYDPKLQAEQQIEAIKSADIDYAGASTAKSFLRDTSIEELPTQLIELSKDVPNFKSGANERGVVHGDELKAEKYDRLGTAPIVVWQRNDGRLEVVSGRHRLDLAKRLGEKTIPSQIVKESDGFSANMARVLDSELNIRDGQGTVSDYARYFKESGIEEGEATARGLLSRSKGIQGFSIGTKSSPELFALYNAGRISDAKASAIARGAPNNSDIQRAGIDEAIKGSLNADAIESMMRRLSSDESIQNISTGEQGGLFGSSDAALNKVRDESRTAGEISSEIQKKITAAYDAAKNPVLAREMGVDPKNPEGTLKRIQELQIAKDKWREYWKYPELRGELDKRMAEFDSVKKQTAIKKIKKQRGMAATDLLGIEQLAKKLGITQRDEIKIAIENLNDKEIQKVIKDFGSDIESKITEVNKSKTEKDLESGINRYLIFPETLATNEPKFRPFIDTSRKGIEKQFMVAHDLGEMIAPMMKNAADGRVWELAAAARISGDRFQWTPENFAKAGANESQIESLMALRKTMEASLDVLYETRIREGMSPEQAQAEVDRLKVTNYVPFIRSGDYFIRALNPESGDTEFFSLYKTEKEKNAALQKFQQEQKQQGKALNYEHGDFGKNPESLYEGQSPIGFSAHLKKSFNIPGYHKNMKMAVAEYITSLAQRAAKVEMKVGFEEAFKNLPQNSPKLAEYAQDYARYQMSNEGEAANFRKVMSGWFLAGRISSAAINLTQQLTTTLPKAQSEVGTVKATKYWTNAERLVLERVVNPTGFAKNNPEINQAIETAIRQGAITESSFRELAARSRSDLGEVSGFDKVLDAGMTFFSAAEKWNRYHSFLVGYQIAKERGLSPADSVKYGEQFTIDTQFDYSKVNRPKIARGKLGAPLTTFQLFKMNNLKFVRNLISASAGGDMKAAQGLATNIGVAVSLAGTQAALPFAKDLMRVLEGFGVDIKQATREAFKDNKFVADFLNNGILFAAGLGDISGSLAGEYVNLPSGEFDKDTGFAAAGKTILGVPGAMAGQALDSLNLAREGKYDKAIQRGSPAALSSLERAYNAYSDNKFTNTAGDTLVKDPTAFELLETAGGVTPSRVRDASDRLWSAKIYGYKTRDNSNQNRKIAEAKVKGKDWIKLKNDFIQENINEYAGKRSMPNMKEVMSQVKKMEDPLKFELDRLPKKYRIEGKEKFSR